MPLIKENVLLGSHCFVASYLPCREGYWSSDLRDQALSSPNKQLALRTTQPVAQLAPYTQGPQTHIVTHTHPAAPAPPMYPHLGVPLCATTQAGNSLTNNKMGCNYFGAVTCWARLNGLRNMCYSWTPLLSRRSAFYSSQTEVNALQSTCVPACESLCECVFDGLGEGGRQSSGWW